MEPTEAIEQLGVVAAQVAGLREVQYPAKGLPPKYPGLALLWGETTIQYQSTEQYWDMTVRGLLMTGLVNDTQRHIAEVDPLIAPLASAFSSGNLDGFLLLRPNGDTCDGCQLVTVNAGQEIGYAGLQHYGAELLFNIQLRRFTT